MSCSRDTRPRSSPSPTVKVRVPLGPRAPIVIACPGRCATIAAATSSTEAVGRPARALHERQDASAT